MCSEAFWSDVRVRGLDAFVLLFHYKRHRNAKLTTWQEELMVEELERLEIPYVSSKYRIQKDQFVSRRLVDEYYILQGPGQNHLTPFGNEVVFGTLADGLRGKFDSRVSGLLVSGPERGTLRGSRAFARFEANADPPYGAQEDVERIVFGVGDAGPTELEYILGGSAERFSAVLERTPLPEGFATSDRVEFSVLGDGNLLAHAVVGPEAEPLELVVDLEGVDRLTFVVADGGDGRQGDFVFLASPCLR